MDSSNHLLVARIAIIVAVICAILALITGLTGVRIIRAASSTLLLGGVGAVLFAIWVMLDELRSIGIRTRQG